MSELSDVSMNDLTRDQLRIFIKNGQCPFCKHHPYYILLARHTYAKHGISSYELKEMAGLNRYSSICDPDHSEKMRQIAQSRPPELQDRILKLGRTPEVVARRDFKLRDEGRVNQLTWLLSPRRIEICIAGIHTPEAIGKIRLTALTRPPEVVKKQTERVIEGNRTWHTTHTKEERSERQKRAYQTWIENTSQKHVNEHFTNMRKMIPHEAQVKAAQAAAKVIPLYHADPEWKSHWRENFNIGMQKRKYNTMKKK